MCLTEFTECVLPCSSVHMEESSVMQGAQGMLVQNWPTVSSAAGESMSSSQDKVKKHLQCQLLWGNGNRKLIRVKGN